MTVALFLLAGQGAPQADPFALFNVNAYRPENRPVLVFPPPPREGRVRISPYPMSKRAASVWVSDFCWKDCTGETGWRFQDCGAVHGLEACRPALNADNRACLRACRTRGGPLVNLAN